jgi:hypothetical protein
MFLAHCLPAPPSPKSKKKSPTRTKRASA